ncbi:type II toxin-antitoxin system RelE/ParE family toxin [Paraburkholderia tropica]|uniref:type II toxin-antitoxin system RelE/ParE family toxin n=1 Tax=Paraburkholderia tropica TaxID=92647 RepID=UPI001FC8309A|nr:type II toxin-antitoxin system RelE/ParE family toxin [Paraburkholderia tropica]
MPRLIVTQRAIEGLERCRRFLSRKTPEASRRAAQVIDQHFRTLEATPAIGRPIEATPGLRELVIPFGDTGYVALSAPSRRRHPLCPGLPPSTRTRLLAPPCPIMTPRHSRESA